MSEPTQSQPSEELAAPGQAVTVPESDADEQTPDTDTQITQLTQELTESRERGDVYFEALKAATLAQASADVLVDVEYMPADDPRYFDENGFPSFDGMRTVAEELATAKPYLARVRGNVSQGAKEQTREQTWSDVMRAAVR